MYVYMCISIYIYIYTYCIHTILSIIIIMLLCLLLLIIITWSLSKPSLLRQLTRYVCCHSFRHPNSTSEHGLMTTKLANQQFSLHLEAITS